MSGCQLLGQKASAGLAAGKGEAAAWMKNLRLESEMVKSISAAPGNSHSKTSTWSKVATGQCDPIY